MGDNVGQSKRTLIHGNSIKVLFRKFEILVLGTLGKLVSASFQEKYVLLRVVVLLCSIHECTVDLLKVSMKDSIWVLFRKFETLVLGSLGKSSGWEHIVFLLFKFWMNFWDYIYGVVVEDLMLCKTKMANQ
jgi:hypothetical protein